MMLDVSDLRVAYGPIVAVHGLSFGLQEGETLALLGSNGAGKSSAVEAIAGLLPKVRGRVRLQGRDLSAASASAIARQGLALVPQWRGLFPNFSVEETLIAARTAARGREPRALDEVYHLFPALAERRRLLAGALSGGQQQMLAIARALVTAPSVLLLDEPSAGLAANVLLALVDVLRDVRRGGVGLVLVEQDVEFAAALCDRCIVLAAGHLTWEGPVAGALQSEEIRRAYFG